MPTSSLHRGTVKWFSDQKGFGFIECSDFEETVFVHYSAIDSKAKRKKLFEKQRVEFELSQSDKGPQAVRVKVVS